MSFSPRSQKYLANMPIAALVAAMALAGCNTIEGAGQDLASAGRGIERAADGNDNGPYVTQRVNMRAGPSQDFPQVDVVKSRASVTVHGCLARRDWCDVSWNGSRGWVSSRYIQFRDGKRNMSVSNYDKRGNVQTVRFTYDYWDSYYTARPWYNERAAWERRRRPDF
jgi:uncharacterized protein YraI/predicted small secreted protein